MKTLDEVFPTVYVAAPEVLTVSRENPLEGNHAFADLTIRRVDVDEPELFKGPGLYALFLDGAIFYVGVFTGREGGIDQGDIITTRWQPHLGAMTLRGRKVSVNSNALAAISEGRIMGPLAEAIGAADPDVVTTDRGMCSAPNKIIFATRNWDVFGSLSSGTLGRISMIYVRARLTETMTSMSKVDLRERHLKKIETELVQTFTPLCNDMTKPNDAGERHYVREVEAEMRRLLAEHIRNYLT